MRNDMDTLRPEVRRADSFLDSMACTADEEAAVKTIRAELLRLANDNAMLRGGRFSERDWRALKSRAEKAEAELAALRELHKAVCESAAMNTKELAAIKARVAEAQKCSVVALCGGGTSLSHEPYDSLIGQRVALVKVQE